MGALKVKTVAERVAELIAAAPPLTIEQRESAVRLLTRRRPLDNRPAARARGGSRAA